MRIRVADAALIPISATTCRCRAMWPSKSSKGEADVLISTPGDLEAATKLMVKKAIHAGSGEVRPESSALRADVASGGAPTRSLDGAASTELPDPGYGGPVKQHVDGRLPVAFNKQAVGLVEPRRPLPAVTVGRDECDQTLVQQPPESLFGEGPVLAECRVAVRAQQAAILDERSRNLEVSP